MSESFSGLGGGNRSARRRAGKQQPAPAAQPLAAALAHHRAGRLDRAETLYRQRLQIAPRDPDALHLLGVLAFDRGALDRAIGLIEAALAQRPRFAAAQASLGRLRKRTASRRARVHSARR